MFVKAASWLAPGESRFLRWRIRRELRRLKAERDKLQQALLPARHLQTAISNWTRRQP